MEQASRFDGPLVDPISLLQGWLAAPQVGIGQGAVFQALVIAPMVVMFDQGFDLLSEIAGQEVVLLRDAVLEVLKVRQLTS